VECLNKDYCETSATAQQTRQVGSLVMLSNAIMSLQGGDERAFSCRCHIFRLFRPANQHEEFWVAESFGFLTLG
jgi:hypothetical protein